MKLSVNVRFLVCLLLVLGVSAGGVHLLHGYQFKRNARAFLDQAERAEQEADKGPPQARPALLEKATAFRRRYLVYRPEDTPARARLGELLEELATTDKARYAALLVYDEVLIRKPELDDIRRKAIKLCMVRGIHSYTDAMEHLKVLLGHSAQDGELLDLYAQCLEATGDPEKARDWYKKAIDPQAAPPAGPEAYGRYAALLRKQFSQPAEADKVMVQLVKAQPTAAAYLQVAQYWGAFDTTPAGAKKAAAALAEAQKRAPDDPDVLLQSARMALAEARPGDAAADKARAKARAFLRRGVEVHPRDYRMYLLLADVEGPTDRARAVEVLRQGLAAVPGHNPGHTDLLWELADRTVEDKDQAAADDVLGQLARAGLLDFLQGYFRARRLFAQGEWRQAANALERVRPELDVRPGLVAHADLVLARCYEKLGDLDRQYAAYQNVVKAQPTSVLGNLGLGGTLEAMGRPEEALRAYQVILRDPRVPEVRLRVARLLIARNQGLAAAEQNWDEVDRLLDEAGKAPEAAADVAVLRAQSLLARGRPEQAEEVLTAARKGQPKEAKLWIALAALAERSGRVEATPALFVEAERAAGDSVDLRLARAAYWARREAAQARPALARLAEGAEKFSAAERKRLLSGLARAHTAAGDKDGAAGFWSQVVELGPKDLGARVALFDLALQGQDMEAVQRAVEKVREIEGAEGTLWKYAKAAQLVEQARKDEASRGRLLAEARPLLEGVTGPRWLLPRVHLCAATLERLADNPDAAIARYQKAVELGERRPETVEQAVRLLYARRRFADAEVMLKKLPRDAVLSDGLQRLAADVSLRTESSPEHAVELARKAVKADDKDYRAHLWLGQVLSLSPAHHAEAEKALRHALQLAGDKPETWVALVEHLARAGQKDEAKALIGQAEAKLPKEQAPLALARCFEAVGQLDRAKGLYAEQVRARPDDPQVLDSAARFYLGANEPDEAKKCLRRIVELNKSGEDRDRARRTLDALDYSGGDYQAKRKVLARLGILDGRLDDVAAGEMPADDLRARALLLASQWGRAERLEAIRLLEVLHARQPLGAADEFVLGLIYDSVGKWPEASKHLSAVVGANPDNLSYLAVYVNSLLRHQAWDSAAASLAKLEAKQPTALATVQLKARLLKGQGQDAEAAAAVTAYAATKGADLLTAARLLEALELPRQAEGLYRRYARTATKPEAALYLADFYGRQGRTAEALRECERAAASCPPRAVAFSALQALALAERPAPYCAQVERWVEEAARKEGAKADWSPYRAALRTFQERYDEAVALYRQALARNPKDTQSLNNLAFVLALQNKPQEALALVQRAQDEGGPNTNLADTRAFAYLKMGDPARAVKELEGAVANAPSAVAYFHLAQAHEAAKDRLAARVAFAKARELNLRPADLHLLERPAYEQMARSFAAR